MTLKILTNETKDLDLLTFAKEKKQFQSLTEMENLPVQKPLINWGGGL